MVEMFLIWLGTTVTSVGISFVNSVGMMKDFSDAGYKLDIDELREFKEKNNNNNNNSLYFLIPFVNVLYAYYTFVQYNNNRFSTLNLFRVLGLIEKMSDAERKEYEKNPTGLHAYGMLIKDTVNKVKRDDWLTMSVEGKGSIKFKLDDSKKIITSEPTGEFAQLSKEEQDEFIINTLKRITLKRITEKEELENPKTVEPNKKEEPIKAVEDTNTKEQESLSRSERIKELKKMREELVGDSKQEEKGFQKKKH